MMAAMLTQLPLPAGAAEIALDRTRFGGHPA
jgi:hypothetical protein